MAKGSGVKPGYYRSVMDGTIHKVMSPWEAGQRQKRAARNPHTSGPYFGQMAVDNPIRKRRRAGRKHGHKKSA